MFSPKRGKTLQDQHDEILNKLQELLNKFLANVAEKIQRESANSEVLLGHFHAAFTYSLTEASIKERKTFFAALLEKYKDKHTFCDALKQLQELTEFRLNVVKAIGDEEDISAITEMSESVTELAKNIKTQTNELEHHFKKGVSATTNEQLYIGPFKTHYDQPELPAVINKTQLPLLNDEIRRLNEEIKHNKDIITNGKLPPFILSLANANSGKENAAMEINKIDQQLLAIKDRIEQLQKIKTICQENTIHHTAINNARLEAIAAAKKYVEDVNRWIKKANHSYYEDELAKLSRSLHTKAEDIRNMREASTTVADNLDSGFSFHADAQSILTQVKELQKKYIHAIQASTTRINEMNDAHTQKSAEMLKYLNENGILQQWGENALKRKEYSVVINDLESMPDIAKIEVELGELRQQAEMCLKEQANWMQIKTNSLEQQEALTELEKILKSRENTVNSLHIDLQPKIRQDLQNQLKVRGNITHRGIELLVDNTLNNFQYLDQVYRTSLKYDEYLKHKKPSEKPTKRKTISVDDKQRVCSEILDCINSVGTEKHTSDSARTVLANIADSNKKILTAHRDTLGKKLLAVITLGVSAVLEKLGFWKPESAKVQQALESFTPPPPARPSGRSNT